jgi:hypothetical protein
MQTINTILPFPNKQSLKTLVNLEFLKGICVLDLLKEKKKKKKNHLNL